MPHAEPMADLTIARVRAREVLDSRGRPTVEADVLLASGSLGRASVPSGASTGRHEAVELRDGEPARYRGLGVRRAVANVVDVLGPAVAGMDAADQRALDRRLVELDGTPQKGRLGANALLAVSLAACRAAASGRGVSLTRHLADLAGAEPVIPMPMVNMISGGLHAGRQLDIQDVLAVPLGVASFSEAMEVVTAIHVRLGERLRAEGHPPLVADEGGWAPPLRSNEAAIEWVAEAIAEEGVTAGIALDVAASHLFDPVSGNYALASEGHQLEPGQMTDLIAGWVRDYPIVSVEDALAEDDWPEWASVTRRLGRIQLVGDDLFATRLDRVRRGIDGGVANAVLVKPNQAGTLTEALDVIALARAAGFRTVVSARSGETEDAFLADLAVGTGAGQIKVGSVTRSERLAKWNQVLRLEEELKAPFAGAAALEPLRTRQETTT